MQFPQRDLTGQHISTSYQDVVQRYLSGSTDYLLDGLGFVIASLPVTSIGGTLLTQDQTASFATTASFAMNGGGGTQISTSWASSSFSSTSASYSVMSDLAQVADVALMADTASISVDSISASFASVALSSSWAPQQQNITLNTITASTIYSPYITTTEPTSSNQVVTKNYVDSINTQAMNFYFRSSSADVVGYENMYRIAQVPISSSSLDIITTNASASQYIAQFISPSINQSRLSPASFTIHYHVYRVNGNTANTLQSELYIRSASVETLIGVNPVITLTTDINASYVDSFVPTSSIYTNLTDRLVVKFKVINGTGTPNVHMVVEDNTSARLEVPLPASAYVMSSGDTMSGPLTNSLGFYGTSSYATSASWAPSTPSNFSVSSSWASQSLSSSNSTTASYAINGGGAILQVDTIASNYTVSSSNNNHLIQCVANLNITLPNVGVPSTIYVSLIGNVTVGFLTGSGMTVAGQTSITGDGTFVTCVQTNSNTWEIYGTSATPRTLYSNLIAFWPMDQVSPANMVDIYGLHGLGPTVNTSSANTGLTRKISTVFSGSQNYVSTTINDSDAKFNFGDTDFSISSWVYPMSSSTNITRMMSRYDTVNNKRAYTLAFDPSSSKFQFAINNTGLSPNTFLITSDAFGTASYNNWYNVIGYHDSVNNIIGLWVNGLETTGSWPSGSFSATNVAMNIGGLNSTGSSYAKMQDIGIWGKVLSTSEKSLLYNSGKGLTYPFII